MERMEWMQTDFFYGFALQRLINTDSFVLTFSVISTALFPSCVMSTVGDISLRLRIFYDTSVGFFLAETQRRKDALLLFFNIKELRGIKAMEHGCSGWNGWTRIFLDLLCKGG